MTNGMPPYHKRWSGVPNPKQADRSTNLMVVPFAPHFYEVGRSLPCGDPGRLTYPFTLALPYPHSPRQPALSLPVSRAPCEGGAQRFSLSPYHAPHLDLLNPATPDLPSRLPRSLWQHDFTPNDLPGSPVSAVLITLDNISSSPQTVLPVTRAPPLRVAGDRT